MVLCGGKRGEVGWCGLRVSFCGLRVAIAGGVAAIEELPLLKSSETHRLYECQWLVGLDLAVNVRRQPRHEAA